MGTTGQLVTAAEALAHPGRCELVRGELIEMAPGGAAPGRLAFRLGLRLGNHVERSGLGVIFAAETGFQITRDPDTVRAPDVAFVSRERMPPGPLAGFFQGPPDLAVEVLSPDDRASDVLDELRDWLEAGCRLVWLVDPRTQTVSAYRPGGSAEVLSAADTLSGGDVLAGFSLPVGEIFAP